MSRTKRHIPTWANKPGNPQPYLKTWIGLGDNWQFDTRDELCNGYDGGYRGYHYAMFISDHRAGLISGYGGWRASCGKSSRVWHKKNKRKRQRSVNRRWISNEKWNDDAWGDHLV